MDCIAKYRINFKGSFFILLFTITILLFLSFNSIAQYNKSYKTYVGISVGQETLISLPRFGIINRFPNKYQYNNSYVKPNFSFYLAGDISIFGLVAFTLAPSVYVGINYYGLTLDNSFAYIFGGVDRVSSLSFTVNPKIGYQIGRIWFKTGPSFILWQKYSPNNLSTI